MKSFYVFVNLLILSISSPKCFGSDTMMMVNHPDVELMYQLISKPYRAGVLYTSLALSKSKKYQLCMESVEATYFLMENSQHKNFSLGDNFSKSARAAIEHFYNHSVSNALVNFLVNVAYSEDNDQKYVVPCVVAEDWSWALIVDTLRSKHFYALSQMNHAEWFQLQGLVEPAADPKQSTRNGTEEEEKELELSFYKGHIKVKFLKENFCKWTRFQKFRLCSAVFMVWREKQQLAALKMNFMPDHNKCVKKARIHFKHLEGYEHRLKPVRQDLLPCAVNEEFANASFYLAVDHQEKNGIFVLKKEKGNVEDDLKTAYAVVMHVKYKFNYFDIFA